MAFPGEKPKDWVAPEGTAPAKRGCGFWALVGGGVLLGLIVLGALVGPTEQERAATEESERSAIAATAETVSAQDLWAAYEANEAAAQQRFGDRPLRVTGTIEGIRLDLSDDPFVTLETGNMYQSVQVDLADEEPAKVSALAKGQAFSALCTGGVSEIVGTPILRDCRVD